jgi:hypothetical protein
MEGERRGEIEQGERRDLAADFGTTTVASCAEGSGREQRAERRLTGVAVGGGGVSRTGSASEKEKKRRDQNFFPLGACRTLTQEVVCRTSNYAYKQLIQPIDR